MNSASPPRVAVVIEDDADIRNLLEAILGQAGFTCHTAGTGPEGIDAIREHEPILTTLDISLPGIDGFEVARQIRSFSSTYIIMLSARDEEIDTLMGLDAGRRRLPDQAVPSPRAPGPDRGHAAALPPQPAAGHRRRWPADRTVRRDPGRPRPTPESTASDDDEESAG